MCGSARNQQQRKIGESAVQRVWIVRVVPMPRGFGLLARSARRGEDATLGMPRILLRHIIAELLRVQLLTASVLVAVIAFGAAIRPIMQNLLGAQEVLQYVMLASVPMLQYALPFAGAFAGTIVYARLAADNEVLAMSAAGLSYRKILAPALALGVALFLIMAVLVDLGVPRFWLSMRNLITRDVTKLFVSAVERGEAFNVGGTQLYADEAMVVSREELEKAARAAGITDLSTVPVTRLGLAGVAAVEVGPDGLTATEFTAERATVDVYRANDSAYLKLIFRNATAFREGEDALVYVPQAEPEAIDLGRGVRIEPKDLDSRGLLALWADPLRHHRVADARTRTIDTLESRDAWACMERAASAGDALRLSDGGGRRSYEVRGARFERGGTGEVKLVPRTGNTFELLEFERGVITKRARVAEANFDEEPRPKGVALRFELRTRNASVEDVRGLGATRWPPRIVGLLPDSCTKVDRTGQAIDALTSDASEGVRDIGPIAGVVQDAAREQANELVAAERRVRADIVARAVQRINQSLAAPLMLLLGAVLAVRLRGANPLQVYLLAFLPSIANVLLISGGEQMLKDSTTLVGGLVASSGNIGIATTILLSYRKIARN